MPDIPRKSRKVPEPRAGVLVTHEPLQLVMWRPRGHTTWRVANLGTVRGWVSVPTHPQGTGAFSGPRFGSVGNTRLFLQNSAFAEDAGFPEILESDGLDELFQQVRNQ